MNHAANMKSEIENMVRAKVQVEASKSGASSPNPVFWTTGLTRYPPLDPVPAIAMAFSGRYGESVVVQSERAMADST